MSGRSLLLMALVGLAAITAGGSLLFAAPGRAPPARYAARLGGVMAAAIGLILIVFAAAWPAAAPPVAG